MKKLFPLLLSGIVASVPVAAEPIAGLGTQFAFYAPTRFVPVAEGSAAACPMKYGTGYYTNACTGSGYSMYVAQLDLPEGADVTAMSAWYYDNSPFNQLEIYVAQKTQPFSSSTGGLPGYAYRAYGLYYNSGAPTADGVPHTSNTAASSLFTFSSINPSASKYNSYELIVYLPQNDANVGFAGAMISYRRQIAPPPKVASFDDIPTTHPFFNEIEQLKKSGITLGCGNNQFCPDSPVTRGQMAAFMTRALGLQWDASTNVWVY